MGTYDDSVTWILWIIILQYMWMCRHLWCIFTLFPLIHSQIWDKEITWQLFSNLHTDFYNGWIHWYLVNSIRMFFLAYFYQHFYLFVYFHDDSHLNQGEIEYQFGFHIYSLIVKDIGQFSHIYWPFVNYISFRKIAHLSTYD